MVKYMSALDWAKDDVQENIIPERKEDPMKPFGLQYKLEKAFKNYGWLVMVAVVLGILFAVTSKISYHNGYVMAQEELEGKYAAQAEEEIQNFKNQIMAQSLLTGEASLNQQIDADAKLLARIGQGVLNTYSTADAEDARKVMICAICRVYDNKNFPAIKSISAAVEQESQWWGYNTNLAVTEEVLAIAREVSTIYHKSEALPCSADMVFAGWNGSEIVLRNQWEANASARYY